jgi:hypothetical protein
MGFGLGRSTAKSSHLYLPRRAKIDKALALLTLFGGSLNKKENSSGAVNQRLITEGVSSSLSNQGEVNR